jgi:hypothetical protein
MIGALNVKCSDCRIEIDCYFARPKTGVQVSRDGSQGPAPTQEVSCRLPLPSAPRIFWRDVYGLTARRGLSSSAKQAHPGARLQAVALHQAHHRSFAQSERINIKGGALGEHLRLLVPRQAGSRVLHGLVSIVTMCPRQPLCPNGKRRIPEGRFQHAFQ